MYNEEERVVRVPLPLSLIRRIDELIKRGTGGYLDRSELIKEALEAYVLELAFEKAPELIEPITPFEEARWAEEMRTQEDLQAILGGPPPRSAPTADTYKKPPIEPFNMRGRTSAEIRKTTGASTWRELIDVRGLLEFASIGPEQRGQTVAHSAGEVRAEPMFGLHNRDYPSLWAATRIARLTRDELIDIKRMREYVLDDAWGMGAELLRLEKAGAGKLSALFPTNREKKPSAEDGFLNFAVGTITVGRDKSIQLSGPLFLWGAAGVKVREVDGEDEILVGLTHPGYELLDAVTGLTPDSPHPRDISERFFQYLRSHSPPDWWGFETVLKSVGKGIGRTELIEMFHLALSNEVPRVPPLEPWTEVQAATNTAGYVARAREWGLLEMKQHRGQYLLTGFGAELVKTWV